MATGLFTLRQVLQGIRQGAWTGNIAPQWVEYLVVAGGGSGGRENFSSGTGGGGGAGGLLSGILPVTFGATLTVTVGAGGTVSGSAGTVGNNGAASVFSTITASGGGGGGGGTSNPVSGAAGGSGGGAASNNAGTVGGQGTVGQGNSGGLGGGSGGGAPAGGGGGAGTVGLNTSVKYGGAGGAGIASAITGTVVTYAGGGGGCGGAAPGTGYGGAGGVGGGGAGPSYDSGSAVAGTANTGGGGGGGSNNPTAAAAGGSGIVIVRYPDNYAAATTATGATISTAGSGSLNFSGTSYLTTTITAIGTNVFTSECWVYVTALPTTYGMIIDTRSTDTNGSVMFITSTGSLHFGSGANYDITSSSTLSINTWYHVAITRTGGTTTCWVNGSSAGTTTDSSSLASTQVRIGTNYTAAYGVTGYISNARIVNGVAVYTGTFTPSTRPLNPTQSAGTNISAVTGVQTILLLNTVSGALYVDNSSFGLTLTPTNTPTWNQLSPFATGLGYKSRVYTWTTSGTVSFVI